MNLGGVVAKLFTNPLGALGELAGKAVDGLSEGNKSAQPGTNITFGGDKGGDNKVDLTF